jgi:hypothetical protein
MKRATARQEPEAEERHCNHPGCAGIGEFRAPKSRADLETYFWFCLRHIREYNRAWNYFKDMSRDEIEAYQHNSNTWHRPTWAVGVNAGFGARVVYTFNGARDDLGAFSRGPAASGRGARRADHIDGVEGGVRSAFAALELRPGATGSEIKRRYKELAKHHHPDRNGGSKDAEEHLKKINAAYAYLTTAGYVNARAAL